MAADATGNGLNGERFYLLIIFLLLAFDYKGSFLGSFIHIHIQC